MSPSIKLFIVGSTGRMGKALIEVLADPPLSQGFQLAGACSGRNIQDLEAIANLPKGSVVVDFSSPSTALEVSLRCARSGSALLECSTGFSESELNGLKKNLAGQAWALTPNTSLGVFVMGEISRLVAELLPSDYNFSIWESHHSAKKDAPSGTAKMIKSQIEMAAGPNRVSALQSVRGGSEVGHHRLNILGPFENLTIEHHAQDRRLFAMGALKLASLLAKSPPRPTPYSPSELWTSAVTQK